MRRTPCPSTRFITTRNTCRYRKITVGLQAAFILIAPTLANPGSISHRQIGLNG